MTEITTPYSHGFDWLSFGFETEAKGSSSPWFKQVHSSVVLDLAGRTPAEPPLPEADAGYTRAQGQRIHVYTADCIPVLLHGKSPQDPIAAIHCGWRGAAARIVQTALTAWDHPAERTHALIGPCIGVCCFEVKEDFIATWGQMGQDIRPFLQERAGRLYCDLVRCVQSTQLAAVPDSQVWIDGRCTVCSTPALPSYRRNKSTDPQIRSWIEKNPR